MNQLEYTVSLRTRSGHCVWCNVKCRQSHESECNKIISVHVTVKITLDCYIEGLYLTNDHKFAKV